MMLRSSDRTLGGRSVSIVERPPGGCVCSFTELCVRIIEEWYNGDALELEESNSWLASSNPIVGMLSPII